MSELSGHRQPDAQAVASPPDHPSLTLYAVLILAAIALTWGAFATQEKPDWPGLLINLAAGLVGSVASRYLQSETEGRIPIVFPLARWAPERRLDDALYQNFSFYTKCWRWVFDRLLRTGLVVVLLDGYEELWRAELPLEEEVKRL